MPFARGCHFLLMISCVTGFFAGTASLVAQEGNAQAEKTASEPASGSIDRTTPEYFEKHIRPLLVSKCYECHSHESGEANGKLVVDSKEGLLAGGTRGPAVVPGKPDKSLLLKALQYHDPDLQMPPDNQLPESAISEVREWIAAGAVDPRKGSGQPIPGTAESIDPSKHWAYQLPQRTSVPTDRRDVIDGLIRQRLLSQGLSPSPSADRRTLIRRVYFDLIGLPPTVEQIQAFENDAKPNAYARLVEELLSSPQFGERWARYWMDVSRYADTKGYVFREEREYTDAYRYRDWLIQAINRDLPYNEFIRYQLAADLIDEKNEHGDIPALGFLTLGRRFLNNKHDIIDDRLDVTARGLMGMTLGCARCHDHKYDPITSKDYYGLFGVFLNTEEPGGDPWPLRLAEANEDRKSFVLLRGSPGNRGEEAPRRFVSFLAPSAPAFSKGSGRLELADQIASSQNPLTARVFVNRVWMRLMGASLVESPSDFGVRCPPPLHQDVLDTLTVDFIEKGWSVKQLIRRLVLTDTYQQSSLARNEAAEKDPQNQYYWRMNRRRMDFEALRDSILEVTQNLKSGVGGKSEPIDKPPYSSRRSVYAYIDRQNVPSVFRNFDVASSDSHSPQRLPTTVPQQGLYLLNSVWISEQVAKVGREAAQIASREAAINALFHQVLRRGPDAEELKSASLFLDQFSAAPDLVSQGQWLCGWGSVNSEGTALESFELLPRLKDKRWGGENDPPDAKLGWCILTPLGGHPGNDLGHVVVRRWMVPRDGTVMVRGKLEHNNENGDGVRGLVLLNQQEIKREKGTQWSVHNNKQDTPVDGIKVKSGDRLDFIVDCRTNSSHDSFNWKVRVQYTDGKKTVFDSARDFPLERPPQPMDAWSQLAQALLMTNEFAFVD